MEQATSSLARAEPLKSATVNQFLPLPHGTESHRVISNIPQTATTVNPNTLQDLILSLSSGRGQATCESLAGALAHRRQTNENLQDDAAAASGLALAPMIFHATSGQHVSLINLIPDCSQAGPQQPGFRIADRQDVKPGPLTSSRLSTPAFLWYLTFHSGSSDDDVDHSRQERIIC